MFGLCFLFTGVFHAHQERDSIARRITAASTTSKSISLKCPFVTGDDGPKSIVGFVRTKDKLKLPYSGAMVLEVCLVCFLRSVSWVFYTAERTFLVRLVSWQNPFAPWLLTGMAVPATQQGSGQLFSYIKKWWAKNWDLNN